MKRKERNRAATTIYGYKTALQKHVYPDLGQLSIQSISVSRLNLFFDGLFEKKELGANSIRKIYDLLKSIFKSAVADEVISKNPIEKIEPIKKQKPEHNYYTIDQFRKLLEIIAGDRMEIVVLLAGILGLRREEIAGLQWTNVDFVSRTIKIVQSRIIVGKNEIIKDTKSESSYRILKLPDYIYELLVTIKKNQNKNRKLLGDSVKGDFSYVVSWEDGTPNCVQ